MAVAYISKNSYETNTELTTPFDFTITKPAGVVNGNVMLAFIQTQGNVDVDAAPAGWTLLHNVVTTTVTNSGCRLAAYRRVASAEGSNYTWSLSGSAIVAAVILAYSGVDNTTPVDISGSTTNDTDSVTIAAPSVTVTASNCMLVTAHACNPQIQAATAISFTPPAGMTERYDSNLTWDGTTLRAGLEANELLLVSGGATGTKNATVTNDGKNCGISVALTPSGGGGGGGPVQTITIGGGEGAVNQCMYGWHDTSTSDATSVEGTFGKQFGVFRAFQDTRLGLPQGSIETMAEGGRLVLWSVKADDWGEVGSGAQDTWINNVGAELNSWNVDQVIFIFYHEPGGNVNATTRTPAKFNAAWQRIHDKWQASDYLYRYNPAKKILLGYTEIKHGNAFPLSGDVLWNHSSGTLPAVIDVLCHDDYNEIHSSNGVVSNQLFGHEDINSVAGDVGECWYDILTICEEVQKPLIIAEFGSVPGNDNAVHNDAGFSTDLKNALISMGFEGNRDGWFDQAADFIKTNELAQRWLRGFCYYHSRGWVFLNNDGSATHPTGEGGGGGESEILVGGPPGGVEGRLGWIRSFVNDSYFTSTPFNPLDPPTEGSQGGGIASAEAFGVPSLAIGAGVQAISPTGIASAEAFGVPTITTPQNPRSPTLAIAIDSGILTGAVTESGLRTHAVVNSGITVAPVSEGGVRSAVVVGTSITSVTITESGARTVEVV